jgi:hypothetical protein
MENSTLIKASLFNMSDHGDYVGHCGRVAISDDDRTCFST